MNEKQQNGQGNIYVLPKRNTLTTHGSIKRERSALIEKTLNEPMPTNLESNPTSCVNPTNVQNAGNVRVVCRVRPLNPKEITLGTGTCVEFQDLQTISLKTTQYSEIGPGIHKFQFDRVFDTKAGQEEVYDFAAKPIVESILEGFNGTIFAYGQTSSGKTYTMQGQDIEDPQLKGIIPRMVNTVFEAISTTPDHIEFTVKVSIVEIYMEKIRDLITPEKTNLKIREDKVRGLYIEDVTETYVSQTKDVFDLMHIGNSNRAICATNMNEGSSRSHLIFMMSIHQNNLHEMSAKTGKLFMVDLAGSEKISKTGAEGKTLEEAKKINQSLSSLGNVINALTDGKTHHIPYRNSKLTRMLQESLGGNSRTALIITCSPSVLNEQETLSTLRFGFRAKSIKNTPKINRQFTVNELQLLLNKAEKLIEDKERRIKELENILSNNGYQIPKFDEILPNPSDELKEKLDDGNNESSASDEENPSSRFFKKEFNSMSTILNNDEPTRIKILEQELEHEKNSVRIQTEKLNILRKEFALLNAKNITNEKENDNLIQKLATYTMKMQDMEEEMRQKDEKLTELSSLYQSREALMIEIENIKKNKEHLLKIVDEKNLEIEKLKLAFCNNSFASPLTTQNRLTSHGSHGNLTTLANHTSSHNNYNSLSNPPTSTLTTNKSTNKDNINIRDKILLDENITAREFLRIFNDKLDGLEDKHIKKTIQDLMNKIVSTIAYNNNSSNNSIRGLSPCSSVSNTNKERNNEIKALAEFRLDIHKIRNELVQEQDKNLKLRNDYDKLLKNYEKITRSNTPSFDDIKQKIVEEITTKERLKYEKEKSIIVKDVQNKLDKIAKLEAELLEEKEKNKALENKLLGDDKKLKLKLNQKQLERKAERILSLEKQLHDTKDLVGQYKGKIESFKALITVSNANNIPINELLNENHIYGKTPSSITTPIDNTKVVEYNIEDFHSNSAANNNNHRILSLQNSNNGRIVKPIRGGQYKSRTPIVARLINLQANDV